MLSHVVRGLPDRPESFDTGEKAVALSLEVTQSIAAYLNSLGDLEEAMAGNLELVIAELRHYKSVEMPAISMNRNEAYIHIV